MGIRKLTFVFFTAVALLGLTAMASAAELTMWSHWAHQPTKKHFVENAVKAFEQKHPGVTIKVTWYTRSALYPALATALRVGHGPDIFYAEPSQVQYMRNDLILDLKNKINWNNVQPWAKKTWSYKGGIYGLPLEAWTIEMYYNKKLLKQLGFSLPTDKQLSQQQFVKLVKKARSSGIVPISLGVGDRPYPGTFLTAQALLKMLGRKDYGKLLHGELSWSDPRVHAALQFVKTIVDDGALPKTFSTLKLGASHYFFYSQPGSVMFLMGSFYPGRAFNPPDAGGQPKGFPLGIMQYPALDGAACDQCKTAVVGGSYVVNAASRHQNLAAEFLNSLATPIMGRKWMQAVLEPTGIRTGESQDSFSGPHAHYIKMLNAVDKGAKFFVGLPTQVLTGKKKQVFIQVINQAFPAGLLSVQQVIDRMNSLFGTGK